MFIFSCRLSEAEQAYARNFRVILTRCCLYHWKPCLFGDCLLIEVWQLPQQICCTIKLSGKFGWYCCSCDMDTHVLHMCADWSKFIEGTQHKFTLFQQQPHHAKHKIIWYVLHAFLSCHATKISVWALSSTSQIVSISPKFLIGLSRNRYLLAETDLCQQNKTNSVFASVFGQQDCHGVWSLTSLSFVVFNNCAKDQDRVVKVIKCRPQLFVGLYWTFYSYFIPSR